MTRLFLVLGAAVMLLGCRHDPLAYQSPYDEPLVSPGMKFLGLPAAVQNTIRAQAGAAEIEDIGRYEVHGGMFYKVWFRRGGSFPPLYIAPDGSVLNSDLLVSMAAPVETYEELASHRLGSLSMADLPAEVVRTVQARAKTLEIDHITEAMVNDKRVYGIHFKGSKTLPMLRIDQEGNILDSTPSAGRVIQLRN